MIIKLEKKHIIRLFASNTFTSIGIILFSFSLVFSLASRSHIDYQALQFWFYDISETKGEITSRHEADVWFDEGEYHVYYYTFHIETYQPQEGFSFSTIRDRPQGPIIVEYITEKPWIHRLKGYKSSIFNEATLIFLILIAAGCVLFIIGFFNARKKLTFIQTAMVATATRLKKPDKVLIGRTRYYCFNYFFTAINGKEVKISFKTVHPDNFSNRLLPVIYSIDDPEHYILVDKLPKRISFIVKEQIATYESFIQSQTPPDLSNTLGSGK